MKQLATFAILLLGAAPVLAGHADGGWTAGLAAAFGDYRLDDKRIKDESTGFRLTGGYRFSPLLGIEAAYLTVDGLEEKPAEVKLKGFSLSGVLNFPSGSEDIGLFAKAGLYSLDQDLAIATSPVQTRKADGILLGAGLRMSITDTVSLIAGYDWYDYERADFATVNVGIDYNFGLPGQ
jgi:opacity protein-like surface antigen